MTTIVYKYAREHLEWRIEQRSAGQVDHVIMSIGKSDMLSSEYSTASPFGSFPIYVYVLFG
jgi:hypothetical protein